MAQKNRADLITEANVIKNETVAKRNTASRVGNMLVNLIDSLLTFLDDAGNLLSKITTSDQSVESNVEFKGQATVEGLEISFIATPTFNFSTGTNNQQMPVEGNVTTFATSNELNAGNYDVWLVNDGTPGRTVATPTGWTLIPGGDTHDDSANAINLYQFKVSPSGLKRYIIKNM